MDDTLYAIEALLGLSGSGSAARPGVGADATAKRKYDDAIAADTTLNYCELCSLTSFPNDTNLNVSTCCNTCTKKIALTASLMYPENQSRSRSPVEEMCLGLHSMEVAEAAMACLGTFLTTTERALFGVALGPTRVSEMVTGKDVTGLDFLDIDKSLAERLTDDHLKNILINIDARNHLKVLKLTGCKGITGIGLEPLRESRVLELIDLSLLKLHESPKDTTSNMSQAVVISILDSILQQGENASIKYIHSPKSWSIIPTRWFRDFMARYETFRNTVSQQHCTLCNQVTTEHEGFTCYMCLEFACETCLRASFDSNPDGHGTHCITCEKSFCNNCVHFMKCQGDYCTDETEEHCMGCLTVCNTCDIAQCLSCNRSRSGGTCSKCGNEWCGNFGTNCLGEYCSGCSKHFCDGCAEFDFCCCGEAMCDDCRRSDTCGHG